VLERRIDFLLPVRQRQPGLNALKAETFHPRPLEAFGVGDAAARRHPVDLGRADVLLDAQAVAVGDLAVEQIGQGRDADVRVRAHVHGLGNAGGHVHGAHVVEEDKRTDRATLGERQDAADLKAAEILAALVDDEFDHIGFLKDEVWDDERGDPRTMTRIARKDQSSLS